MALPFPLLFSVLRIFCTHIPLCGRILRTMSEDAYRCAIAHRIYGVFHTLIWPLLRHRHALHDLFGHYKLRKNIDLYIVYRHGKAPFQRDKRQPSHNQPNTINPLFPPPSTENQTAWNARMQPKPAPVSGPGNRLTLPQIPSNAVDAR